MVDWNKPIRMRNGQEAKLVGRMPDGEYVVATRRHEIGTWSTAIRSVDGRYSTTNPHRDIINVPEETTEFINVYPTGACFHHAIGLADRHREGDECLPSIKIVWIDGKVSKVTPVWVQGGDA